MSAQPPGPPDDFGAPPPGARPPSTPARSFGAPREAGVPRMEHVRVTAPDLARRAALEKTRGRLVMAAAGFAILYGAVALKLADATLFRPVHPKEAAVIERKVDPNPPPEDAGPVLALGPHRATILDRNGQELAVSLATSEVFADPREMSDTADAAHKLISVLPDLDEADIARRLASARAFVYVARRVTPLQQVAINNLGIPGIRFEPSEVRRYPLGRVAAQVLGGTDIDGHGVAGIEKFFDHRLSADPNPLRLSIDIRVQAVVRDELAAAMAEFTAIGAAGIVMDVNTGEILAMVSLPDYDANDFGSAPPEDRFNRAVTGRYEPGSTFKLQTAAMALDSGAAHIWDEFDAAHDIHYGRFTISDFQGKHRFLYLPEVLAYSSNLGAAHIALVVGAARQRAWLGRMGMFEPVGVELPEAAKPLVPNFARWSQITVMTVGFGHGIAVTPLHVVRGTAALANGGTVLRPTLLALAPDPNGVPDPAPVDTDLADGPPPATMPAEPNLAPPVALDQTVMQGATSETIRKLMRLVVTNGYGKPAEVPGYFVGGKTGTAEKVGAHGGYEKHTNVSAFICVFPMNHPRYAVYMMLDEPHGNASTGFYSTAGAVAAPAAGKVIARIAPMLGLYPDTADAPQIDAALSIPMEPARPPGGALAVQAPTAEAEADATPHATRATAHTARAEAGGLSPDAPIRRTAYVGMRRTAYFGPPPPPSVLVASDAHDPHR